MPVASKAARKAALTALAARKAEGKSLLSSYQVAEAQDIYDQVDEEGYKKRVRERLDQDDFVVDDNGGGYADDGREEWDTERRYASESEEELPALKSKTCKYYNPDCARGLIKYSQTKTRRRTGKRRKGKPQYQQVLQ